MTKTVSIPSNMQARAMLINVPVARICIACASFAYLKESDAKKALQKIGLALVYWYDHKETQAFLALDNFRLYLIFRGTKSLGDWITDGKYVKVDFPGGGRTHAGFTEAYLWVKEVIQRDLENFPEVPRVVGGHSLGAALAQEASVGFDIPEGYVCGCPRVGNSAFVTRVNKRFHRFEHFTDPITYIPPRTSPIQIVYALLHWRLPTLYDRANRAHLLDGDLHGMDHYRKSITPYLDAVEVLQKAAATRM